jgi:hypothetical protein
MIKALLTSFIYVIFRSVFFERHAVAIKQTPDCALGHLQSMRFIQMQGDLAQSNVGCLPDQRQDFPAMGIP